MRLEAIETLIPEARIETTDIISAAGGGPDETRLFTALFGMRRVAAADPDLGVAGYLGRLLDRMTAAPCQTGPQVLIHAHSLPMAKGAIPDLSALGAHPALPRLKAVIDVDQFNCAGMFHALQMAERLLTAGAVTEALVFAGDCLADWPLAARYVPSCTVLGDGFALLRLSARAGGVQIGPVTTRHHRGFEGGLDGGTDQMDRYNRAHVDIIRDSLTRADHDASGRMVFPHNINGLAWRLFCRQSGQDPALVHDGLVSDTGHCCNADPFLVLADALRKGPVAGTALSVGMAGFAGAARVTGQFAPAPV